MTALRTAMALVALLISTAAFAQGVTTGALAGVVMDDKQQPVSGASVIAIHEPSGTTYEGSTRADGRFVMAGMRVGGPYSITVAHTAAAGAAFVPQTKSDVTINLGAATDVNFTITAVQVAETVTVTGSFDPVFSSSHTGAATAISRLELSTIPTVSGRLQDVTRLTPQSNGSSIAGSDGRMNNITVDGSSFNSSFGVSASQPGDRTGVAPISLESIEQVQVNIAPYDVRQGSFIGAGVNTVTRSGGNRFSGSLFHRFRNQDWVGTETNGQPFNPGTFKFRNTGGWGSGPIVPNKWFVFGNYEDELDTRPLTLWQPRRGGEAITGNVTRVLESDLTTLSQFLATNFNYETGPFTDLPDETPAKRFLLRNDYNLNNSNKVSFRYNHLNSFTDVEHVQFDVGRSGSQRRELELSDLPEHQLPDPREHPFGHRRVALRLRHDDEFLPGRLYLPGREPRHARRRRLPVRGDLRRRPVGTRPSGTSRSRSTTSCATRRSNSRTT